MSEKQERWKRLKNTTHVNVAFRTPRCDEELLRKLLHWLNAQSVSPASEEQIAAHLAQLERRRRGLDGLIEMAQKLGKELSYFRTRFMDSYSFVRVNLGGFAVSVDLLNAGGELGFPQDTGEIIEVFATGRGFPETPETADARKQRMRVANEKRERLVKDLVRDFDVRFVFGGDVSFLGRYVAWLEGSRSRKKPRRALPWEFLWPLTYLQECSLDEESLKRLPVHHAERVGSGALIQVFEDLHMGYQDRYVQAAHALGLRAVWELHP